MLALQLSDEDMSDSESEEEVLDNANSSPGSDSSGGLRRSLGGLSLSMPGGDDGGGYSEESPPGEKRTRGESAVRNQGASFASVLSSFRFKIVNQGLAAGRRSRAAAPATGINGE